MGNSCVGNGMSNNVCGEFDNEGGTRVRAGKTQTRTRSRALTSWREQGLQYVSDTSHIPWLHQNGAECTHVAAQQQWPSFMCGVQRYRIVPLVIFPSKLRKCPVWQCAMLQTARDRPSASIRGFPLQLSMYPAWARSRLQTEHMGEVSGAPSR